MAPIDASGLGTDKLYEQINANIRATDEISFKLLGLVPLVSGAALGTLVLKDASGIGTRLSLTDAQQARPPRPQRIGKTEAEKIIYGATILAWLALPPAVGAAEVHTAAAMPARPT